MPNLVKSINLTQDDKETLESFLQQSTVEARTYIRAKIQLLKSENNSNEYIADKLDVCISVVRLCIDKFNAGGIESALHDSKGRDPDFDSKMHDVLVIYKQVSLQFDENGNLKPFEGVPVHTLSYDEKPGMQALHTTAGDRPPVPDTDKNSTYAGIMNILLLQIVRELWYCSSR